MKTHIAHANTVQSAPVASTADRTDSATGGSMFGKNSAQGSALQTWIGQSPRMLAQRRAMQGMLGPALHRDPNALKVASPLQARFEGAAVERARPMPASTEPRPADHDPSSATARPVSTSAELISTRAEPVEARPNQTGMPNQLKAGIESLSGMDMSGVRVHRNSDKPAQLGALAYARGNNIHLGPGQEQHLPHEAWHVVQQRQGRVRETVQMAGVGVNDEAVLEREADSMGGKAASQGVGMHVADKRQGLTPNWMTRNSQPAVQVKRQIDGSDILQALFTAAPTAKEPTRHFDSFLGSYIDQVSVVDGYKPWRRFYQAAEKSWWIYMPATDYRPEKYIRSNLIDLATLKDQDKLDEKAYRHEFDSEDEGDDGAFLSSAKVGLELTFNNKDSKRYVKNNGLPLSEQSEARTWWAGELNGWTKGLEFEKHVHDHELEVNIKTHAQKDFGGNTGNMENWRVVYSDRGELVWWWQLSMDPGVIEIQTAPTTGEILSSEPISEIVATIFRRARERGFEPGGGGGHVNVDFVTGFGEDTALIPNVVLATEQIVANLNRNQAELAELVDFENELEDPFISTDRVKMQTAKNGDWNTRYFPESGSKRDYSAEWVRDVKEKYRAKDKEALKTFRDAHAKWLHLHPTLSQQKGATELSGKLTEKSDEVGLEKALHYQAVNIDHLFDEVITEDPRRLEFRFFKAQESIEEIIACIRLIGAIVKLATKMKRMKR